MDEITYKHSVPIQIRFNDIDQFGHVNNTIYYSFYDLGKTEYFADVIPEVDWQTSGIVIVHADVDFFSQIFGGEDISVQTAITKIGNKSFMLAQRIIVPSTGEVKCQCISTMCAYDPRTHTAISVPNSWREKISKFEGIDF